MVNNVKVRPIRKVDSESDMGFSYKATFESLPKENLLITVILPFQTPDNICLYAAKEISETLD